MFDQVANSLQQGSPTTLMVLNPLLFLLLLLLELLWIERKIVYPRSPHLPLHTWGVLAE